MLKLSMGILDRSPEEQLAWAVGIFEGEGCIGSYVYPYQPKRSYVCVIAMTDYDTIVAVASIFGGKVSGPYMHKSWKQQQFRWRVTSKKRVREFLERILPFLGVRRMAKAMEILGQIADG